MNYNVTELGTYENNNKYLSDTYKHKLNKNYRLYGELKTSNVHVRS